MSAGSLLAAAVAAVAALWAVSLPPSDPDLFWHLASGDWMLDHRALLDHDVFSHTRVGAPYASGQWLGQILLALAYRAGGWVGIDVLRAALVACGAFFLARATLRVQPHPGWAVPAITVSLLVSKIVWGDRPQLFTVALFPLLLDLLLAARLQGQTRRLLVVPPLFLAWANLHGAFPVGLVLLAIVAVEAFVSRDRSARPLAATLGAALIASQLNPALGAALGWAAAYAATPAGFIVEERPPDVLLAPGFLFASLLLASLGAALIGGRTVLERIGAPLLWPALVLPFALLGLSVQRQMPLACAVLAPFVAAALPLALGRLRVASAPRVPRSIALPVLAVLLAGTVAVGAAAAPREADLSAYPAAALPALRAASGNLLNEYDWGGYLIRFAPERPTFIDGRGALLFVPEVLDDFERAVRVRDGYRGVLARRDVALALLRPDRPLAEALQADGWRVLARDPRFVLLGRP